MAPLVNSTKHLKKKNASSTKTLSENWVETVSQHICWGAHYPDKKQRTHYKKTIEKLLHEHKYTNSKRNFSKTNLTI